MLSSNNLHNFNGKLCTIQKKKYLITKVEGTSILVSCFKSTISTSLYASLIGFTTNIAWIQGVPYPLNNIEDGIELYFDAIAFKDIGYQAIIIWSGTKPAQVTDICPNEFLITDELKEVDIHCLNVDEDDQINVYVSIDDNVRQIPMRYECTSINGYMSTSQKEMCCILSQNNNTMHKTVDLYKAVTYGIDSKYVYICHNITSKKFDQGLPVHIRSKCFLKKDDSFYLMDNKITRLNVSKTLQVDVLLNYTIVNDKKLQFTCYFEGMSFSFKSEDISMIPNKTIKNGKVLAHLLIEKSISTQVIMHWQVIVFHMCINNTNDDTQERQLGLETIERFPDHSEFIFHYKFDFDQESISKNILSCTGTTQTLREFISHAKSSKDAKSSSSKDAMSSSSKDAMSSSSKDATSSSSKDSPSSSSKEAKSSSSKDAMASSSKDAKSSSSKDAMASSSKDAMSSSSKDATSSSSKDSPSSSSKEEKSSSSKEAKSSSSKDATSSSSKDSPSSSSKEAKSSSSKDAMASSSKDAKSSSSKDAMASSSKDAMASSSKDAMSSSSKDAMASSSKDAMASSSKDAMASSSKDAMSSSSKDATSSSSKDSPSSSSKDAKSSSSKDAKSSNAIKPSSSNALKLSTTSIEKPTISSTSYLHYSGNIKHKGKNFYLMQNCNQFVLLPKHNIFPNSKENVKQRIKGPLNYILQKLTNKIKLESITIPSIVIAAWIGKKINFVEQIDSLCNVRIDEIQLSKSVKKDKALIASLKGTGNSNAPSNDLTRKYECKEQVVNRSSVLNFKKLDFTQFYECHGSIYELFGDEGLMLISSNQANYTVYSIFHKCVAYYNQIYLGNHSTKKFHDVLLLMNTGDKSLEAHALVYQCKPEYINKYKVKLAVALLWLGKKPKVTNYNIPRKPLHQHKNLRGFLTLSKAILDKTLVINCDAISKDNGSAKGPLDHVASINLDKTLTFENTSISSNKCANVLKLDDQFLKSKGCKNSSISLVPKPTTQKCSKSLIRKFHGKITSVSEAEAIVETENEQNLTLPRNQCFLYGINLDSIKLTHLVKIGYGIEFSMDESETFITEGWIGGGPRMTELITYRAILTWCTLYDTPRSTTAQLLHSTGYIPPECNPIYNSAKDMEEIEV